MTLFRIVAFVLLVICLAPLASVAVAGYLASSHGCVLHEGFPNPCIINGEDWGETLYAMGVMGWLMLATLPLGAVVILAWIIAEIGRVVVLRRRAARASAPPAR